MINNIDNDFILYIVLFIITNYYKDKNKNKYPTEISVL